jgi:hypothetical protein
MACEGGAMSRKEIVVLASRAVAFIEAMSALLYLTELPAEVTEFLHYFALRSVSPTSAYLSRYYAEATLSIVLRIAITAFAALLFWECGPKIEKFLLPAISGQEDPVQPL